MLRDLSTVSFTGAGLLPHDVQTTLEDLEASWLVSGVGVPLDDWSVDLRRDLVQNLRRVVELFEAAGGVDELWINGSFVEQNPAPGDIDGYFTLLDPKEWRSRAFQQRLELRDPGIWTWKEQDRRQCWSPERKPPFWCKYRVELYPDLGRPSDIQAADGTFLLYRDAFRQQTRTSERKGIVKLVRQMAQRGTDTVLSVAASSSDL